MRSRAGALTELNDSRSNGFLVPSHHCKDGHANCWQYELLLHLESCNGCSFCIQLEAACLQWSFVTYNCDWELSYLQMELLLTVLAFMLRERKMRTNFVCTNFLNTPRGRDIPAKFPGHPRVLSSKPKEDKLSREGTNFSATTPSRGRPPPHRAVSRPKKIIFVLFFLPEYLQLQCFS